MKVTKIVGGVAAVLLLAGAGAYAYVEATHQKDFSAAPLPAISASTDPEVIAAGDYLVNTLLHCSACHGPADAVREHNLGPKGDLRGGFKLEAGPFGTYYPANITPDVETGIGKMSDGQLARAIRHGVHADGRLALFMSFVVGHMSDRDLTAVVSYLRTIPPVKNAVPPDEWGFIAKVMAGNFKPKMLPPIAHVASGTTSLARGEYLANGPAFCVGCHTAMDMTSFEPTGPKFSGEPQAEPDPYDAKMEYVVPNLTPDPDTGIMSGWTEDFFVQRFRQGRVLKGSKMPWNNFATMTESDLRSLYRYLRSLPPTRKVVGPSFRPAGWRAPS